MTSESIPSLGSETPQELHLINYEVPLPKTRPLILKTIFEILEKGAVQKLLLEVGHPIRFWRLEKVGKWEDIDAGESPQVAPQEDLLLSARNAEIIDLAFNSETSAALTASSPFHSLFWSFHILQEKGLHPEALIVHQKSLLNTWLRLDSTKNFKTVFGAKIIEHQEMPEGSILLVGVNYSDRDTAVLSLRLELDIEEKANVSTGTEPPLKENSSKRISGEKHNRVDGEVEVPSRRGSRSSQ